MRKVELAGVLLCTGNIQFFLLMTIAAALYPGYTIGTNYISDLGVGPTSVIFNGSIILLGICTLCAAILLFHHTPSWLFSSVLGLAGFAAVLVGVLPGDLGVFHVIAAATTFLVGAIAAITAYHVVKPPFCYVGIILGLISLACFVLFAGSMFFSIGPGGMERLIAYPVILWGVAFGGYLMEFSGQPDPDFLHRFS